MLASPDGTFEIQVVPLSPSKPGPWVLPVDHTAPVDSSDEFLYHKTTRRQVYESAQARFPDAPDVVLINQRNELTETTIGNLVVQIDGQLCTPPVASGLLPGTFRAELVATGMVVERVILETDLAKTTRQWMVNSVRGWTPIEIETASS